MKKLSVFFALVAVLLSVSIGSAGAPSVLNPADSHQEQAVITFAELGRAEILLVGPYDTSFMYFSLPPTWATTSGSTLSLTFTHLLGGGVLSNSLDQKGNWIGGSLLVYYNGQLIDTIVLDTAGQVTKVIAIPESAYRSNAGDGRQDIRFFLDASTTCDYEDLQSSVLIHGVSFLNLIYDQVPPPADLSIFPRPIYQANSLLPNKAVIVIPDSPSAEELQAALTVSAGFGSITEGAMALELIQAKDLSEDVRRSEHLIFVGKATGFSALSGVQLPVPLSAQSGIKRDGIQDGDGVIEIAQSPWDASHLVLVVTGNTDAALVKAAQALSTGKVILSGQKDLSIIAETAIPVQPESVPEDVTLAQLGQKIFTLGGYSGNYMTFDFYVSANQVASEGAYFDVTASYSGLMNVERTGFSVILNETTIGSLSFLGNGNEIVTERIEILPNVMRRGRNTITIYSDLVPFDYCYAPELDATWVTLSDESTLHLPISIRKLELGKRVDLKDFPSIFLEGNSLEDFAVVLPKNDLVSWNRAAIIVSGLGAEATVPIVNLSAVYADEIPEAILKEKNILLFGQASTLPIISELNNFLPAPFAEGSDEADQPTLLVTYRLLPNVSVGYLQLLPSPWNLDRVILMVMGNTPLGIPMAADALLQEDLKVQLAGNFSILYGSQILTTDTRLGQSKDGLIAELPANTIVEEAPLAAGEITQELPTSSMNVDGMPKWIIPVFATSTALILLLIIFILRREASSRIKSRKEE